MHSWNSWDNNGNTGDNYGLSNTIVSVKFEWSSFLSIWLSSLILLLIIHIMLVSLCKISNTMHKTHALPLLGKWCGLPSLALLDYGIPPTDNNLVWCHRNVVCWTTVVLSRPQWVDCIYDCSWVSFLLLQPNDQLIVIIITNSRQGLVLWFDWYFKCDIF